MTPRDLTIHSVIDEDYFCISLTNTSKIKILLYFIHALGDIDVSFWCEENGSIPGGGGAPDCPRIIGSSAYFTDNEEISAGGPPFNLGNGDYYIRVRGAGGATNIYDIVVKDTQ